MPDLLKDAAILFLERHPPATVYRDELDYHRVLYAFLSDHFSSSVITRSMVRRFAWILAMLTPREP